MGSYLHPQAVVLDVPKPWFGFQQASHATEEIPPIVCASATPKQGIRPEAKLLRRAAEATEERLPMKAFARQMRREPQVIV